MGRFGQVVRAGAVATLLLGGLETMAQAPTPQKLSRKEIKERVSKLEPQYQQFLDEVQFIITDEEKDVFLRLDESHQRDRAIDDFWLRRDPFPGHPNEYQEKYMELLATARGLSRNLSDDQPKTLILRGEPDAVIKIDCERFIVPVQVWYYEHLPRGDYHEGLSNFGSKVSLLFYKPNGTGTYRLWQPLSGSLDELLSIEGKMNPRAKDILLNPRMFDFECRNGDVFSRALFWMQGNKMRLHELHERPDLSKQQKERASSALATVIQYNKDAPQLNATAYDPAYVGVKGTRTVAEFRLDVPTSTMKSVELPEGAYYQIQVVGEILKEGKLYDKFNQRFDFPTKDSGDSLPVIVPWSLREGEYKLRLWIKDNNSLTQTLVERNILVPQMQKRSEAEIDMDLIKEAVLTDKPSIKILSLDEVVGGTTKINTKTTGGVAAVEFYYDNKKIATRSEPPFSLDIALAPTPERKSVKVVALDKEGNKLAGDEYFLNERQDTPRVRITSPRVVADLSRNLRVEISTNIPKAELESLEISYNNTKVAELYAPPYEHVISPQKVDKGALVFLSVRAKMKSGEMLEDVVILNSPTYAEQVKVHAIELPITVTRNQKLVNDPSLCATFKVLDNGQPIQINECKYQEELPLTIGLAVDSSSSMDKYLRDVQRAAGSFLESVMREKDKAFVLEFNDRTYLAKKTTGDLQELKRALSTIYTQGQTALHDAITYSLFNFQDVKGRKALVILSDGEDTHSTFSANDALEYAKRSGIPIYAIPIGEFKAGYLKRLTEVTGGGFYPIKDMKELPAIYQRIESELRGQYLVTIMPSAADKQWHTLKVLTDNKGDAIKTIQGFYP